MQSLCGLFDACGMSLGDGWCLPVALPSIAGCSCLFHDCVTFVGKLMQTGPNKREHHCIRIVRSFTWFPKHSLILVFRQLCPFGCFPFLPLRCPENCPSCHSWHSETFMCCGGCVLHELGVEQLLPTVIFEDNNGARLMTNAQQPTRRTRHVELKQFAALQWVEDEQIAFDLRTQDKHLPSKRLYQNAQFLLATISKS